jgi:hypothetical protein
VVDVLGPSSARRLNSRLGGLVKQLDWAVDGQCHAARNERQHRVAIWVGSLALRIPTLINETKTWSARRAGHQSLLNFHLTQPNTMIWPIEATSVLRTMNPMANPNAFSPCSALPPYEREWRSLLTMNVTTEKYTMGKTVNVATLSMSSRIVVMPFLIGTKTNN